MKQWDIFLVPHPTPEDPHPAVIISNDLICANPQFEGVNVLTCQTVRPPQRPKKPSEVYLDEADGLNWRTLAKCDFIHIVRKSEAMEKRGEVCPQRIAEIRKRLQEFF